MENNHLIQLENVKKIYRVGETQVNALRGLSYNINEGDFLAIMGPSGSGKSTLMNIVGCLDKPTEGKYFLEGEEVSTLDKNKLARIRNKKIGFVFQTFNLLSRTTALENTELPLLYSSMSKKKMRELASKSLSIVGLEGRELHRTNQLSGGEQQRVAIARAIANEPSILFADEPTGNLDEATSQRVMANLIETVRSTGLAAIIATHDHSIAEKMDRMLTLSEGKLQES